jgi:hypothetical protein
VKKSQTADALPAGNVAGTACGQGCDRTIHVLFSAITATTCDKFPVHDGQGNRIEWQGIFCGRQGIFRTSPGFLHTLFDKSCAPHLHVRETVHFSFAPAAEPAVINRDKAQPKAI